MGCGVYEIIKMLGKTRTLTTIFEEEEYEELVQSRKMARLQLQQVSDWKIIFELGEEEYLRIQVYAHQALDELFELIFDYKSGFIYSHLAQIVYFEEQNVSNITGISEDTAMRLKLLFDTNPNNQQINETIQIFKTLFTTYIIAILQNITLTFPHDSSCLPGAIRLVLSLLPLQKYKAFGMLCLTLHSLHKRGHDYCAEASEILTGSTNCKHLFQVAITNWDSVFVLQSQ